MRVDGTGLKPLQYGFSLVEILVVVVIIGIFAGSSLLLFDGNDETNQLRRESQRFKQLLKIAMDESLIHATQLGIVITQEGYQFLQFNRHTWQPVQDKKILKLRYWPKNVEVSLQLEGLKNNDSQDSFSGFNLGHSFSNKIKRDQKDDNFLEDGNSESSLSQSEKDSPKLKPQIYILSSGEITPFKLLLQIQSQQREPVFFTLESDVIGQVEIIGPLNEKPENFNTESIQTDSLSLNPQVIHGHA